MKLAFVTELFHPNIGGQEVRYYELSEHLAPQGIEITVLTIDHLGSLRETERIAGAKVHRLISNPAYMNKSLLRRDIGTIREFSKRAHSFLRDNPQDVVVFNQWPLMPGFGGKKSAPVSIADVCEFRSGPIWTAIENRFMRGCHKITTVSTGLEAQARRRCPGASVKTIPSGINVPQYYDGGRNHFIFAGRLAEHKHPEMAIEATLAFNRKYRKSMTLKILGDGPFKPALLERYGKLSEIEFCGFVSTDEKIRLLAEAEILLLPSIREGFPRVIAEAMASGAPTVTTNAVDNGSKDVVAHYDTGIAVPLDAEAFADAIDSIRSDYSRYRDNCLQRCGELDWKAVAEEFLAFAGEKHEIGIPI